MKWGQPRGCCQAPSHVLTWRGVRSSEGGWGQLPKGCTVPTRGVARAGGGGAAQGGRRWPDERRSAGMAPVPHPASHSVVCTHTPAPAPVAPLRTAGLAGTWWGWVAGGPPRSAPSGSCSRTVGQSKTEGTVGHCLTAAQARVHGHTATQPRSPAHAWGGTIQQTEG